MCLLEDNSLQTIHSRAAGDHLQLYYYTSLRFGQMFMDLVLEGLLREHLMVGPLLVVVGITEQLVTMGAEDFKVWTATAW